MRRKALWGLGILLVLAACPEIAVYAEKTADTANFSKQISRDDRILQALNRLTFGARPGDAAQVKAMGLKKWIDQQLHPQRIAENPVLLEKLKPFDTLTHVEQTSWCAIIRLRRSCARWSRDRSRFPPILTAAC